MSNAPATSESRISQGSSLAGKIREAILAQRFKPGDRLNETSLARKFKSGRILIREALMRLEEQGLVINQPRRGMFVNSLSAEETKQVTSIRLVLESEAIKLCRAQCTPELARHLSGLIAKMEVSSASSPWESAQLDLEFHRTIWRSAGNEYLEKTLNSLCTVLFAHRALGAIEDEHLRWILGHHRTLLEVIEGRSDLSPEQALLGHLKIGYDDPEQFSSLAANAKQET